MSATDEELTEDNLAFLRHFALKVDTHMTANAFGKLKYAFPDSEVASFKITQARAAFLAAFKPVVYHCCINSCCCYVGPHADLETCPYCGEACFDTDKKPRKKFTYSPITPRLTTLFKNSDYAKLMRYRAEHKHDPNKITDIFDSSDYLCLKTEHVVVGGKQHTHKFFNDARDIALGLSMDGFTPFRRRKHTCWPIILFNYNLPPDIRFHLEYILCVAVIPGPKKPKDFDSFLWPLVQELLELEIGVRAFD